MVFMQLLLQHSCSLYFSSFITFVLRKHGAMSRKVSSTIRSENSSFDLIREKVPLLEILLILEHVKFWRPQILLLVGNPRSQWQFIQFCNALKKGALYIIGHIIVTDDFSECLQEIKKQKSAWLDFIRVSRVKAFHQVAISPSELWGMRNLVLNAGLGGLYPNLIVMGFFSLDDWRNLHPASPHTTDHNKHLKRTTSHPHHTVQMDLPTDDIRAERPIAITTWVNIVEDILLGLNMNIAIGKGMNEMELPMLKKKRSWIGTREYYAVTKKYIDLWPIQMSAEITDDSGRRGSRGDDLKKNLVTSNFDTYTMILQMVRSATMELIFRDISFIPFRRGSKRINSE
jgi:solute carrier family 12 (potassium/chloride transporters), member 9